MTRIFPCPSSSPLNRPRNGLLLLTGGRTTAPQDHLVGKGHDGGGRLGRLELAKHVALVVRRGRRPLGDEGEDASAREEKKNDNLEIEV